MQSNNIQTNTIVLYSYWASGLINGDWSSFDDLEKLGIKQLLHRIGIASCQFIDVGSDSWFGTPDCPGLPGDVCEYTYFELEQETNQ
jgi:hypothetical protein